jgi:hypothetical protein
MNREERERSGYTPRREDAKSSSRTPIDSRIDAQRRDEDFQARLSKLIEADRRILDRLAR